MDSIAPKNLYKYRIIIPQEKNTIITDWLDKHGNPEIDKKVKKQLELEEVLPKNGDGKYSRNEIEKAFELGVKWQSERMYSEEEVISIVRKSNETGLTAEYLLLTEQYKKK